MAAKTVHDAYFVSSDGRTLIIMGGVRVSFYDLVTECRRAGIQPREWMDATRQKVGYWEFEDLVRVYYGGAEHGC